MSANLEIAFVVVACFVVGYWVVGALLKNRSSHSTPRRQALQAIQQGGHGFTSDECHYRHVLGVPESASETDIRRAYRDNLAKYYPAKFTSLGDEFVDLASRRTEEFTEAYEFLRGKYGFR
jgi:DnaJ-domain-containing protein 1